MIKYIKYIIVLFVFLFLVFWGYSKYTLQQKKQKLMYHTTYGAGSGSMLVGGMSKNKDQIELFVDSMQEKSFEQFWNMLDISNKHRKNGDLEKAIAVRNEALKYADGKTDIYQVRSGLARLYKENKQYDLAINEYEWCINYSNRADMIEKFQAEINSIKVLKASESK